jgi:hypothetical protein
VLARSYPVEYSRGVHLPLARLWLDPRERRDLAVVSHAHGDHIARHRAVVCTEPTYRLLTHRVRGSVEPRVLGYGESQQVGEALVSLHPAGHVLGAAQVLVRHSGLRILYSGDIRIRPSLTCAPLEHVEADVLIVETTFGHQRYRFPPAEEVVRRVVRFCEAALADGEVPVLVAYSLGKAQELLCQLRDSGLPVLLHPAVHAIAHIYRELGVDIPHAGRLDGGDELDVDALLDMDDGEPIPLLGGPARRDAVVVVPPHLRHARCIRRLEPVRRAVLTGWAIDGGTADRLGCDTAFPLSDHCDFDELVTYTLATGARRVYTLHGFAQDFARHLRSRGLEASALRDPEQLSLAIG